MGELFLQEHLWGTNPTRHLHSSRQRRKTKTIGRDFKGIFQISNFNVLNSLNKLSFNAQNLLNKFLTMYFEYYMFFNNWNLESSKATYKCVFRGGLNALWPVWHSTFLRGSTARFRHTSHLCVFEHRRKASTLHGGLLCMNLAASQDGLVEELQTYRFPTDLQTLQTYSCPTVENTDLQLPYSWNTVRTFGDLHSDPGVDN